MKDIIKKILTDKDIEAIFEYVIDRLYKNGPVSVCDMEILSLLKLYHNDVFKEFKNSILNYMALFYKDIKSNTLKEVVFGQYKKYLEAKYSKHYTPVQANIVKGIENNNCFSFSAPTSTGKSFVFMNKIQETKNDVVVVVPSRALINEYYLKLNDSIKDKSVNVLTFIDKINTRFAKRNVFIVTPERCRELFKLKNDFNVDLFLFDEAQLSDENSKRGLYFDSIVRRCYKAFPQSKFVFAHPFVKNPESQIEKNHFKSDNLHAVQFNQKSVGQLFLCTDDLWNYYHFGIDKTIMGKQKHPCPFDPIEQTIKNKGSVLFYVSKAKIYNKKFINRFSKYINLCEDIKDPKADYYIEQIKEYTGGDTNSLRSHYSQLISFLKKGIVIHHGSLPLQIRLLIEQFTKDGLCRLCFATSTLEQGINMPFDVVFLDRLDGSKPLAVKNLIGRAGRSSLDKEFDFGYVIVSSPGRMSKFREIIQSDEILDNVSLLEKEETQDDDYNDFKEAIINDTYSDEYNLTEKDLQKLSNNAVDPVIKDILNSVFHNDTLIPLKILTSTSQNRLELYAHFQKLYSIYLGRNLERGEQNVFNTAIKIILWQVHGKTFKNICWYRYAYASKSHERDIQKKLGQNTDRLEAAFFTEYKDLPDKRINVYNKLDGVKAKNVDYDLIMFDTYDYIDKLIGFKLSDILYATFYKYYERKTDSRALKLAKFIKYGTDNEKHIWMLRYGMSFEDIELLEKYIDDINSTQIVFKNSIYTIPDEDKKSILRFLN
ncbi:DEAD/DEAH box helicase [Tenacibaculum caenipelagi]|uniref:Helicase-like protein n=1 Tax=Tenacibaculum caenipelagi TaxID=1325435 RepID=A0A4R6TBR8_9FLAO|nr:DEAD/DEAH box helicase [Tenacibaculum caenipelagi]TDQ23889.1 helicase-like protein [Tenacibaculum caenipelagi]